MSRKCKVGANAIRLHDEVVSLLVASEAVPKFTRRRYIVEPICLFAEWCSLII